MVNGSYSKNVIDIEARLAVKGAKEFEKQLGKTSDVARSIANDNIDNSRRQGEALANLEARTETYNKLGEEFNTNQAETAKLLGAAGFKVGETGDIIDKAGAKVDDYTTGMRENVDVLSKFQMENLGVMFAGMALDRAMTNLNATSREWLGIGELTSTMMGITMLSANMDLLEFGVLPLFDALTNLPPAAQKAIGLVSIALEGLGGMMFMGGQLMLGLDSTATLLSKIAGVSPNIIFTEKGLGALGTKLSGTMDKIKKLGKLAGAGILISIALKDLDEGKVAAVVGDAFLAAGLLKSGKGKGVLFTIGVALKIAGDEDAQATVARTMIKIADIVANTLDWISDSWNAVWDADREIDWTFGGFSDTYRREAEKMVQEGEITSNKMTSAFSGMTANARGYEEEIQKITDRYEEGGEKWVEAIENTNDKYVILLDYLKDTNIELQTQIDLQGKIKGMTTSTGYSPSEMLDRSGSLRGDSSSKSFKLKSSSTSSSEGFGSFVSSALKFRFNPLSATAGKIREIVFSPTYNVNVSDKREFETMIRENNTKQVNELGRMSSFK